MENRLIKPQGILKNLNQVLCSANHRFKTEYTEQEVTLTESFKIAFRKYLLSKKWDINYFDKTSVIISNSNNKIYVANQWFVIASYFVDFCSEMISYREVFIKICREMGMDSLKKIKDFAYKVRSIPSNSDKDLFLATATNYLAHEYSDIQDDYDKVASYIWRFCSDYSWWSGNKTIDRHDFYLSPLLNQMNVVNANAEYLGLICEAYASVLKLRILVNEIDNFTIDFVRVNSNSNLQNVENTLEPLVHTAPVLNYGISISAASLQNFQNH